MLKRASDGAGPWAGAGDLSEQRFEQGTPEGGGLDIRAYLRIARRRGPMVVAIAILVGLMGQVYALQLTPLYTARATLMLDAGKLKILDSEAVLSGANTAIGSAIGTQMGLMRSRDVARRVAEKLNLQSQPKGNSQSQVGEPGPIAKIVSLIIPRGKERDPVQDVLQETDALEGAIGMVQGGLRV